MRLIDADRLKAVLEKNFGHTGGASVLEQLIDEQPTIEPSTNCSEIPNSSDAVSRQAAINVTDSEKVSTNPEHFKSSEKFIKFMDDDDIASFGRWQWANGFNTALVASKVQLEKLPSAQPERAEGEWVQIQRCARDAQPDLECPFCKHRIGWFDMGRYCAGCGAKLKGGAG